MERWTTKLVVLAIIFVVVFAFTVLPIKVSNTFTKRGKKGQRIISYFMCFGGGVFLGVYMLHMAPDVRVLIDAALTVPMGVDYPIPDLIIVLGFFLMVFSEHFVHSCYEMHRQRGGIRVDSVASSVERDSRIGWRLSTQGRTIVKIANGKMAKARPFSLLEDEYSGGATQLALDQADDYIEMPQKPLTNGYHQTGRPATASNHQNHTDESDIATYEADHDHSNTHLQVTRSLVLLLALSLHHVFEGLSIGLKQTTTSVWSLCIAIVSHEVVIAFSLGMQMVKTYKSTRRVVVAALMCSSMVPLGMLIGMALTETGGQETDAVLVVNGVLQGLATGVFIYVTFFEILQQELGHGKADFGKLMFIFFGFAVLAALALIPEEEADFHSPPSSGLNITENCTCSTL